MLTLGGKDQFENGKMKPTHMLPHKQLIHATLNLGFSAAVALSPILATYEGKENLFFLEDHHWTAAATKFVGPVVAEVIARTAFGRSVSESNPDGGPLRLLRTQYRTQYRRKVKG